jgi:hypothetical protein
MLNLTLWLSILLGFVALVVFAWRSSMRRRGFRLLKMLEAEGVLRYGVDVPVAIGDARAAPRDTLVAKRGTLVITRKRVAGFVHRRRFVLVRGGNARKGAVRAENGCLVIRIGQTRQGGVEAPAVRFLVPDAEAWAAEARKVLRV